MSFLDAASPATAPDNAALFDSAFRKINLMHREGLQPAAHGSVRAGRNCRARGGDIPKAEVDTGRLNRPSGIGVSDWISPGLSAV